MSLCDGTCDSQAQPRSHRSPDGPWKHRRGRSGRTVEEDPRIDIDACVFHGQRRGLCRAGDADGNIASLGRVTQGIGQQVAHRTSEHQAIAFDLTIAFQPEPDALGLSEFLCVRLIEPSLIS